MSVNKTRREARMVAERTVSGYRGIYIEDIKAARHIYIIIKRKGIETRKKIFLSSTPSCPRWAVHLKKDIRRAIREIGDYSEAA